MDTKIWPPLPSAQPSLSFRFYWLSCTTVPGADCFSCGHEGASVCPAPCGATGSSRTQTPASFPFQNNGHEAWSWWSSTFMFAILLFKRRSLVLDVSPVIAYSCSKRCSRQRVERASKLPKATVLVCRSTGTDCNFALTQQHLPTSEI